MPELDTLRGIAVLGVLFVHGFVFNYGYKGYSGLSRHLMHATSFGKLGVNLFFVLSGFLITGILVRSKDDPRFFRNFYARRALRILPAYGLTLLWLLVIGAPWRFVALSAMFMANLTPLFGVPMFFGPLWSLGVEEHFYLVWPALTRRLGLAGISWIAAVIWVAVPVLRFAFPSSTGISQYTWFNCDGLALGALIQILAMTVTARGKLWGIALSGLAVPLATALLMVPVGLLDQSSRVGVALQLSLWNIFFAGLLLTFLLLGTSVLSGWVTLRPLRFIGHISYGLYLIHLIVFWQVNKMLVAFFPRLAEPNPSLLLVVAAFLIGSVFAISIAWLSRKYFEERFLRLKGHFESAKPYRSSKGASSSPS